MIGKILCFLGFHNYVVDGCIGTAIYGSSLYDWLSDDNFIFKCCRCGKDDAPKKLRYYEQELADYEDWLQTRNDNINSGRP